MGLLDDAIREHLDLKRRRGADPAEVARLEQEALGPVRREPAPTEPAADAPAAPRLRPRTPSIPIPRAGLHPDEHTHVLAGGPPRAAPWRPAGEQHAHDAEPAERRPSPSRPRRRRRSGGDEDARPRPAGRTTPPPDRRDPPRPRGRRPTSSTADDGDRRAPDDRPRTATRETCSRRRRTSCRRRRSTTGSGSSSAPRATSTSTDSRGEAGVGAHRYTLLDVFTATPLEGNALAVVHDADELDDATMLAFARETRLTETTFVQRAHVAGADYRNRIWTVERELPFAGHPSLGTAVAVARAARPAQPRGPLRPADRRRPAADRRPPRRRRARTPRCCRSRPCSAPSCRAPRSCGRSASRPSTPIRALPPQLV